ncbi:MAG: hypothetical protein FWG68_00925, partial [Defluviitaleaceae bacterium]|nr:hypothetical protein [Defluviitaleaceae bacterium]
VAPTKTPTVGATVLGRPSPCKVNDSNIIRPYENSKNIHNFRLTFLKILAGQGARSLRVLRAAPLAGCGAAPHGFAVIKGVSNYVHTRTN